MDDQSWYVVAVEPQAEDTVAVRATRLGIPAYYPVGKQFVRKRSRVIEFTIKERAVMAGYVFVQGAGHFGAFRRELDAPDAVPHCVGWLSGPDGPEPVRDAVVADLRQRQEDGEFDVAEQEGRYWAPRWMRAGVKIRITTGPLSGKAGEIWRITAKRRVAIWLQMLGSVTLAECPLDWVAKAR